MIKKSGLTFFSHLIMPQLCDAEPKKQPKWCEEIQYKNQLLAYIPNIEWYFSRTARKFRSIFRNENLPNKLRGYQMRKAMRNLAKKLGGVSDARTSIR
jgi:hypothetical protein